MLLRFVFLVFVALLLSCGGNTKKDLCDGVTCEFGVCDGETGICVNAGACNDVSECLEGFDCIQSQCVAEFPCNPDGTCDRGECVAGSCLNPERCAADNDCAAGFACDGDVCIEDRCDLVSCDRGVCEKETGDCVNAAVCTSETEGTACLDGFVCYDQSCADEETICSELECDRGVCSAVDLACVNAESCEGDDLNCLDGYFCNAGDQCQLNVCDENMTMCSRGVCDPRTGDCINAENCSAANECTDGFYCVDGACQDMTTACDVCVGNQVCGYDDASLEVFCDESPDGCSTSIDCLDGRECNAGMCAAPSPCEADALEPNDSLGAAVDWFANGEETVTGTVCSGDADYFAYDVTEDPDFTGTLIATIGIPAEDVGIGSLNLELYDEDGTVVASTSSAATDSVVRVEFQVGNINQGVYTLGISDSGDVGSGGIAYTLFMDLLDGNAADLCANAPALSGSAMGDTSQSMSNGLEASCATGSAATEEAYLLTVAQPSFVKIDVTNATFDSAVSIRAQCEAQPTELACGNDSFGSGSESIGLTLDPGQYTVIVDGASGTDQGTYTLSVTQSPVVCTDSDNSCVDMTTASVCNGRGTAFETVTCPSGCDMGAGTCIREIADVCATAIDATNGFTGTVSLGNLENDYAPACVPTDVSDGADAVFNVQLGPDEVVYAFADPVSFDYISMYVLDDCSQAMLSCLEGVDDGGFSSPEELVYTNTTGVVQDLYVVVDAESFATGDVDVEIVTGAVICTPGETRCTGSDLETCNVAGTAFDAKPCGFGCDMTTNACTPPPNDVCGMGAIDVSAGGTFTGTVEEYANDYEDTNSCTGFSADGPDAVYVVTGNPGDVVDVSLDGPYDTSLYAVTGCGDIAGTCLDGEDSIGQAETIQFALPDTNPVYIVADSFSTSPTGTFTLDVTVRTPDCSDYGQPVACSDSTTLQYCDSVGFFADYTCATTCSGARCDEPTGNVCHDAIPLVSGQSYTGNFDDLDANIDPGANSCIFNTSLIQDGPEAVFEVQLTNGQTLEADLTTMETTAGMYVLSSCADAASSCQWAAPRSDRLEFFAPTTGTYFLVVDSTTTLASGEFTLDINVTSGDVCQPGGVTCDTFSNTLSVCADDGSQISETITCAHGCTPAGYCEPPPTANDTCATAEPITSSTRFIDDFDRFAADIDPTTSTNNTCSIADADGLDAVYEITLGPTDVLDVTVDDFGSFGDTVVYIVSDCSMAGDTCLEAEQGTGPTRVGYVSPLGETVYLVVDNTSAFTSAQFEVDIQIRPSQCVPGAESCIDGATREYCNNFGELVGQSCFFGCNTGQCNPPTNDTCASPLDVSAGGSYTIQMGGYNADYDLADGNSCNGFESSGEDAVFSLTPPQNSVVTVELTSEGFDSVIYVTEDCGDLNTCTTTQDLIGESGATETVQFIATANEDYFIYADAYVDSSTPAPGPTDEFTMEVTLEPQICTPGDAACGAGGMNIETCNSFGTGYDIFACDAAGCTTGTEFCNNPTGEYCADAFDGNASGMFSGSYLDFNDDLDLDSATSCTGYGTPGPDNVYYVDLMAGQTLSADLNTADDSALYILSTCSIQPSACLDGDDQIGSGESVTYTATADERVYVVVDAFDSTADSTFTLNISVQ